MRSFLILLALVNVAAAPTARLRPDRIATPDALSAQDLERIEREHAERAAESAALAAEADDIAVEIARLQDDLVSAAVLQGATEREALGSQNRIAELETSAEALRGRIAADREGLIDVLAALQRIARFDPPAVVAAGENAADAARAARLLAEIAPALEARTARVRAQLDSLEEVRARLEGERVTLGAAETSLNDRRAGIVALITTRTALEQRLRADAQRRTDEAQSLAEQAISLRDFIEELEARARDLAPRARPVAPPDNGIPIPRLRPDRPGTTPIASRTAVSARFPDARGALLAPAAGEIIAGFGDAGARGRVEGLAIRTRERAQVTSPFAGVIQFAGFFRGYGQLLIVDVGDGYHIVLAGLSTVYGVVGQDVLAGEPLGEMPGDESAALELYMELRKDGEPIDPQPWLRG